MAKRIDKLLPASFKGIPFLVKNEALTEGGRKIVLHDYPDSSQRFVEDLGELPPRFKVQAFVQGDNWRERAGSIERALKEKGPGKLQLPTFGSITIYALPYSKDASQQSVGIISFSLEFASGKPANAPAISPTTIEEVFQKGDDARLAIQESFEQLWTPPSNSQDALAVEGDITSFSNDLKAKFENIVDTDTLKKMIKKVNDINNSVQAIIRDPLGLALILIHGTPAEEGLWQLASIGVGVQGAVDTMIDLTEYGAELVDTTTSLVVTGSAVFEDIGDAFDETANVTPYWRPTTASRVARNTLRRLSVRTQRINALVGAYEQAAAGEYLTTNDIDVAVNKVEGAYNKIMQVGTDSIDAIQSVASVRFAIEDVRRSALSVMEQKTQQAFGLVGIDKPSPSSQFVTAYNLYAEEFTDSEALTERSRVLKGLNPDQNGLLMSGDTTALQNRVVA